jgi:tRNA threonylcarbamoyladenosine biosynthesis protein TsaB
MSDARARDPERGRLFSMLILALDTTTRSGSIALARDGDVLSVASGDLNRTHAERLPGDIVALLAGRHLSVSDLDGFVVAAGPGSFTGLRIGIATVQGLAFALHKPVVGISTLDALAALAAETGSGLISHDDETAIRNGDTAESAPTPFLAAAWMDAQRLEVFAALYGGDGELVDGPVSQPPAQVLERWAEMAAGRSVWFAGDGMIRYRDLIEARLGGQANFVDPLPPLAPTLAALGLRELAAGRGTAPHAVRPVYVRRPDAELARDRNPR